MPILQQIGGWKPWYYARTIRSGYATASAPLPPSYLPARAFWAETFGVHCVLPTPWSTLIDPYAAFLSSASTGTLLGTVGGLAAAELVLSEGSPQGEWGIGKSQQGIPTVGYCIGDAYKEHSYFSFTVVKLVFGAIYADACIDVFQRSKLKRLYIMEGTVVNYSEVDDPSDPDPEVTINTLTIDYNGIVPTDLPSVTGDTIAIYKPSGIINLTILELLPNWEMLVDPVGATTEKPESGDFYKFDSPWCIQDPFLMSGFWREPKEFGPYTLSHTSHNLPYSEVNFTGFYVYQEKDGALVSASAGTEFGETETHEWAWIYYEGEDSYIYKDGETRYFTVQAGSESDPDFDGVYVTGTQKEFVIGAASDIVAWKDLEGITYIRMEINLGGNSARQNWHSPILTRCWLNQDGKYFAILGQPDANVIDVSLKDVLGTTDLSTAAGPAGTILNQYAWMINEHYTQCGESVAFLEGRVISATYSGTLNRTTLTWESLGNSYGTVADNTQDDGAAEVPVTDENGKSFYTRFVSDSAPDGPKKVWNKYEDWKVFDQSQKRHLDVIPDSVVITPATDPVLTDTVTEVSVSVEGDMTDATIAGFFFEIPYERLGQLRQPVFIYTMEQAIGQSGVLPYICVDLRYRSAIMSVLLDNRLRVGSCGARFWGLGAESGIWSEDNLDLFITVPTTARAISSFFHDVSHQDWIFFQDINTNRVTLRAGSLDFIESPRRAEVIMGFPDSVGTETSFPITFDPSYERVKLISMKLPTEDGLSVGDDEFGPSAITFQVGNIADYFGFTSTGSGVFDFQALRENGYDPGEVDYALYKNSGQFLSPVYKYKNRTDNIKFHEYDTLELGIPTSEKLYVKNGEPSDITIEYVANNQTLHYVSFFDAHHLGDGEVVVFHGKNTDVFELGGEEVDPTGEETDTDPWPTTESIYVTGTANNGFRWGSPMAKLLEIDGDDDYQYPTMIMNSVQYLHSYYNGVSQGFVILLKAYAKGEDDDGIEIIQEYIAILTINTLTLVEGLRLCEPEDDFKFWMRDSRIYPSIFASEDTTYTIPDAVIEPSEEPEGIYDLFIRVIGPEGTNSKIESTIDDMGIMSLASFPNGMSAILYSHLEGVGMLSSPNLSIWGESKIILARDAHSPFWLEGNLFYITPEGIEMKSDMDENMNQAALAVEDAGYDEEDIESLQEVFDNARTVLIGSGKVGTQRLSGHVSHDGTVKIFYYNSENILACLESDNTFEWNMASNF